MYDLTRFTLSDVTRCGIQLRKLGAGASSMEEVAEVGSDLTVSTLKCLTLLGSAESVARSPMIAQLIRRLGIGGLLSPGELFATVLFSRVPIARERADLYRTLALNVKVAVLPFAGSRVFA